MPPRMLAASNDHSTRRRTLTCSRKAPPENMRPDQSATVLVALAGIGGTPVKRSVGKAIKLPPPATAFMAPPTRAAANRSTAFVGLNSGAITGTGSFDFQRSLVIMRHSRPVLRSADINIAV